MLLGMERAKRRHATHALVWGAATAFYLFALGPILQMAALDFELVVVNQFELDAATLEAIPWGRGLVQIGPLPLLLAALVHAGYRALRPWSGVSGPFALTTSRRRALAALLLGLPFLAAVGPLAVAMSVLVAVELTHWAEWHLQVDPAVQWAFAIVPTVAVPALLWAALRAERLPPPGK